MQTPSASEDLVTIDELAAGTSVPSRTIREYQRLGLLPPPRRDGRVGRYGAEHRARLSIIGRLQQRGYSLAAIGDLMGSWEQGRGLGSVLGVDADPAVLDEAPTELSRAELVDLVPALGDRAVMNQAVSAGIVNEPPDATDTVIVRSLAALELVALAIDSGMSPRAAVAMAAGISAGARAIARAAVDEFVEQLWPRRGDLDLPHALARARLLLAQASASLVVHELGAELSRHAAGDGSGELAAMIERIAIGQIRRLGSTGPVAPATT